MHGRDGVHRDVLPVTIHRPPPGPDPVLVALRGTPADSRRWRPVAPWEEMTIRPGDPSGLIVKRGSYVFGAEWAVYEKPWHQYVIEQQMTLRARREHRRWQLLWAVTAALLTAWYLILLVAL